MQFHGLRCACEQGIRPLFGMHQQFGIPFQIGNFEHGYAALARAQQFTGASNLQIGLGNHKAIGMFINDLQPFTANF